MTNQTFNTIKVKDLISNDKVQSNIKQLVSVPRKVIIKQVRNPFTNEETKETTQKVRSVSGTSLQDMVEVDFTLLNSTIDPLEAINHEYEIVDYSFNLEANMRGGNFNGYSPTGLKLLVTKIEKVKEQNNEKN